MACLLVLMLARKCAGANTNMLILAKEGVLVLATEGGADTSEKLCWYYYKYADISK